MTTPPPKPDSEDAQLGPGPKSFRDVLIFDNRPLIGRIFGGIYALTIGIGNIIFMVYFAFSGESSFLFRVYSLAIVLGAVLWIALGHAILTEVEKLVIDFSQQTYELDREGPPRVAQGGAVQEKLPIHKTGSLREVSHLRLRCFYQSGGRGGGCHVVAVLMVWKNDQPKEFTLKYDTPFFRIESAKKKLKTYAEELASRLQVPVIEDVEA